MITLEFLTLKLGKPNKINQGPLYIYIYIRPEPKSSLGSLIKLHMCLPTRCLPTRYKTFTSYFIQPLFKTLLDLRLITFYFFTIFHPYRSVFSGISRQSSCNSQRQEDCLYFDSCLHNPQQTLVDGDLFFLCISQMLAMPSDHTFRSKFFLYSCCRSRYR